MSLDYHWHQVGYGADLIAYDWEHPEAVLANAQGVTARLALEVMRGAVNFDVQLQPSYYNSQKHRSYEWKYETLTGPSAFYVAPERYLLENYGLDYGPEHEVARWPVAKALFLRLYGAERALYDKKTQDGPAWPTGTGIVEARRLRLAGMAMRADVS